MAANISIIVAIAVILAVWRLRQAPSRQPTTLEGARHALGAIGEWAKWMAGIETATLGGVSWLLKDSTGNCFSQLVGPRAVFAMAGFVFTAMGLFCCAWVLSAVPSVLVRVHGLPNKGADPAFDAYEMSMFPAPSPRLGNMMALQHWFWAIGLCCFGIVILWR